MQNSQVHLYNQFIFRFFHNPHTLILYKLTHTTKNRKPCFKQFGLNGIYGFLLNPIQIIDIFNFLYFRFFYPFSHGHQVLKHFQRVSEHMNSRFPVIYNLDRHLNNFHSVFHRPEYTLKVKRESVHLALGKNLLHRVCPERLTAALRIRKSEAADYAKHFDICF